VFGQYVSVRNMLVTKNEAVKAAWSPEALFRAAT
jgi:hypothetical protein